MSAMPVNDPWLFSFTLRHEHLVLFSAYVLGSLMLSDRAMSIDYIVGLRFSSTRISCPWHRIVRSVPAYRRAAVGEHILTHSYNPI